MENYRDLENRLYYELGKPIGVIAAIDKTLGGYYKLIIVGNGNYGKKDFKKIILWSEEKLIKELNKLKIRIERNNIYKCRKIVRLTHFTKVENLDSILEYGLYSLEKLKRQSIAYSPSDDLRLDGRTSYICNSIMHPNHKMFWSKRMNDESQEWVVLGINPLITIHNLETEFYPENAAKISYRDFSFDENNIDIFDRTSNSALEKLFKGDREENLPDYYPTSVQAEVLVKDAIEPQYFQEIHVNKDNQKVKSLAQNMNLEYVNNSNLFDMRGYRRY